MRELLPVISDDLDWAEKETRTPATRQRHIGWNGRWFLLDLTDDHDQELADFIERYVRAGQLQPLPPKVRGQNTTQSYAQQRNQRIIGWAKENGYRTKPRATRQGSDYIPVATRRAYEQAHPEDRADGVGSDRPDRQHPDAGHRVHESRTTSRSNDPRLQLQPG